MIHWIPGALLWDWLQGSRSPGIPPYARRILPGGIGTTSLTPTYFMIKWERDCTTLHSCAPRLLRYLLRYRPLFPSCLNIPGYPCSPCSPCSPFPQIHRLHGMHKCPDTAPYAACIPYIPHTAHFPVQGVILEIENFHFPNLQNRSKNFSKIFMPSFLIMVVICTEQGNYLHCVVFFGV